jgi:hypothetical protein
MDTNTSTGRPPADCQIPTICGGTSKLGHPQRLRQVLLRLLSAARRRLDRLDERLRLRPEPRPPVAAGAPLVAPTGPLRAGDWVEVLSREEIAATLNEDLQCEGLAFLERMADHCGQRLRVLREVRMLFDERRWRMLRVRKPRYILETAICEGKSMFDKDGCDRCCYYFWDARWLRRVDPVKTAGHEAIETQKRAKS